MGPTRFLATAIALVAVVTGCSDPGGTGDPTTTGASASAPDPAVGAALQLPALHAEPDPVGGGRIVDSEGRQVILRGVNVNALAEYWSGNDHPTTFPLTEEDMDTIAGIGWNTVRLLLSWSRVEPEPGSYDDAYLDSVDAAVGGLAERGIYTIIDLHQDAWGPTLAARPDEGCGANSEPAKGWDGAPGWATLGGEELGTRCTLNGVRETSAAVLTSFEAFWENAPGPGGVGIRTRYVEMLGHLAARWAADPAVAGYDLMNEPNAFSDAGRTQLGEFYEDALVAMREAEAGVSGGSPHLILFEPPAIWSSTGEGPPPVFTHDRDVVYAPHIYTGGFTGGAITEQAFAIAIEEAAAFGGAPVLTGEWGADPARAGRDGDGYFLEHQRLQDESLISATLWTWRESCGDPHKVGQEDPVPWGEFDVDCDTNEPTGVRTELVDDLTRGYVRAGPGRIRSMVWDPESRVLEADGEAASPGSVFVAFLPGDVSGQDAKARGMGPVETVPAPHGGSFVVAEVEAAEWSISAAAPL